jgi:hypothetical protein
MFDHDCCPVRLRVSCAKRCSGPASALKQREPAFDRRRAGKVSTGRISSQKVASCDVGVGRLSNVNT